MLQSKQYKRQGYRAREEPYDILAYIATLPRTERLARLIGTPGKEVERAVDDAAVKPGDRHRYAAEDDLVPEQQVFHVPVLLNRVYLYPMKLKNHLIH